MARPRLLASLAAAGALAGGLLGACTSDVVVTAPPSGHGGEGGDFVFIDPETTSTTTSTTSQSSTSTLSGYMDPGCMDEPPPLEDYLCDPYAQGNGDCPPGEACHIYVDYPDRPCGQEIYGSFCYPAGAGEQGDACTGGHECAGGFVCVVTGSGTQCVALCNLVGASGCPPGLVCEPIDVKGFGGCL